MVEHGSPAFTQELEVLPVSGMRKNTVTRARKLPIHHSMQHAQVTTEQHSPIYRALIRPGDRPALWPVTMTRWSSPPYSFGAYSSEERNHNVRMEMNMIMGVRMAGRDA